MFLSGRGHELLGQPRRRAPRAQVQREHEAAIVWLVTQLEREVGDAVQVLTERECRRLEAAEDGTPYSVALDDGARRWADVVVERGGRRRAIEIEFSPKGSARLAQIVAAYRWSDYDEAFFFVRNAALGRRIAAVIHETGIPLLVAPEVRTGRVRVLPWPGLSADRHDRLARAFAVERTPTWSP